MTHDRGSDVLSEAERATAQRLIDEVNEFNVEATGIVGTLADYPVGQSELLLRKRLGGSRTRGIGETYDSAPA